MKVRIEIDDSLNEDEIVIRIKECEYPSDNP